LATDPRFGGGWVFVTAGFSVDASTNDEYVALLQPPATGAYSTVFRFSIDQGATWTYCDVNGAGSKAGFTFEVTNLGSLIVTP
jgi:hypothetical protein